MYKYSEAPISGKYFAPSAGNYLNILVTDKDNSSQCWEQKLSQTVQLPVAGFLKRELNEYEPVGEYFLTNFKHILYM